MSREQRAHLVLIETSSNQAFIFATNKLRENVGASELTYRAGTKLVLEAVHEVLKELHPTAAPLWNEAPAVLRGLLRSPTVNRPFAEGSSAEVILATSGKALLLVPEAEIGRRIIGGVTLAALRTAPGLDVLGVVSEGFDWNAMPLEPMVARVHQLHESLRSERVSPAIRFPLLPILAPCATSGRPACKLASEGQRTLDVSRESWAKQEHTKNWRNRIKAVLHETEYRDSLPDDLDKLERYCERREWLSVVHADGNGLGQIFLSFGRYLAPPATDAAQNAAYVAQLREFSLALEEATERAFVAALNELPRLRVRGRRRVQEWLPIIPLLIGGDDLTAVCDGEYALPFARAYLRALETETERSPLLSGIAQRALQSKHLTACAGVAVIKPHFPFHQAYELAEELLRSAKRAKKVSVGVGPENCSALDFHILYDSTFTDLESLRTRLQVGDTRLTAKPYVVTGRAADFAAESWALDHHVEGLDRVVAAIAASDDDGRNRLPNGQLHDLREGLFQGRNEADARMHLIRHRYQGAGLDQILERTEGPGSLFRPARRLPDEPEPETPQSETRFLDALEAACFWGDVGDGQQGDHA